MPATEILGILLLLASTLGPTGRVQARIAASPGEKPLHEIELRLSLATDPGKRGETPRTVSCPVREGACSCEVPAGRFDLRIKGEGMIPIYRWGLTINAGKATDLGALKLQRGASVAGWVVLESGEALPAPVRVELAPERAGLPATQSEYDRLRARALETKTTERGFFQLTGVPPGTYVVTASGDGFAPARRGSIVVREGLQSELLEPLQLSRPLPLAVRLDPPLDPFGQPWRLRLMQGEAPGELNDGSWEGTASSEGLWQRSGLAPGGYRLFVLGERDERWATREIQLVRGRTSIDVEIPLVPVQGKVTIGDEPLAATLWFGGRKGARRIRFDSDEKGKLSGLLPEEGLWQVELAADEQGLRLTLDPVEVKTPKGKTTAFVEVRVPDTRLAGEVVDEAGRRVPRALITLLTKGTTQVYTDEEGRFELRGLKPGPQGIEAEDGSRTSGPVEVVVEEKRETPRLHLVLREMLQLRGHVTSRLGPRPGAELIGFPAMDQVGYAGGLNTVTNADGSFAFSLPAATRRIDLLVFAPGFAMRMLPVTVEKGRPLEISVEPDGGTLVLELPDAADHPPLLAHAGTFTFPSLLRRWATLQRAPQTPGRLTLPNVEPGAYSFCVKASAELRQGQEPPGDGRCVSGVLAPFGELTLRIPGSP